MERAQLRLAFVSCLALLGCGSSLPVVAPGGFALGLGDRAEHQRG
jgi:hypothetical protein